MCKYPHFHNYTLKRTSCDLLYFVQTKEEKVTNDVVVRDLSAACEGVSCSTLSHYYLSIMLLTIGSAVDTSVSL